jgi:hypothetical protein
MASSSTHFRNRPSHSNDENSKDLKSNIRESRLIQPEQWQSPEIQEKFEKVIIFISICMIHIVF